MDNTGRAGTRLHDKLFTQDISNRCNLTVEMSLSSVVCTIFDTVQSKFIAFENFNKGILLPSFIAGQELLDLISDNEIFSYNFLKTTFLIRNQGSTIIPFSIYDENYKASYMLYNNPNEAGYIINSDILSSLNIVNLYNLQISLKEAINTYNSNAQILHSSTSLIKGLFSMFKNKINETSAFIHIGQTYFDMVVISQQGELLFYNSFKFKNADDLVYYVLFAFEQLKLKPVASPLYLLGEIEIDSQIFERLYKYIGKIYFLERNNEFKYSYILDIFKEHYYFSLFNKELCE